MEKKDRVTTSRAEMTHIFFRAVDAVIRIYDGADNVIETHEHKGDFKEW